MSIYIRFLPNVTSNVLEPGLKATSPTDQKWPLFVSVNNISLKHTFIYVLNLNAFMPHP